MTDFSQALHVQSAAAPIYTQDGLLSGWTERHYHYALRAPCPTCFARVGTPCKSGEHFLPPLQVHYYRAMPEA